MPFRDLSAMYVITKQAAGICDSSHHIRYTPLLSESDMHVFVIVWLFSQICKMWLQTDTLSWKQYYLAPTLLTEPLWSGYGGDTMFRVSDFMAAYGKGRSLTRQVTDGPEVERGINRGTVQPPPAHFVNATVTAGGSSHVHNSTVRW